MNHFTNIINAFWMDVCERGISIKFGIDKTHMLIRFFLIPRVRFRGR